MEDGREIPGFPGYTIYTDGRVRGREGTIMVPYMDKKGYPTVRLYAGRGRVNGRRRTQLVHRLVLLSFVGPAPAGKEACHNNGVRSDPRLENLRWDTRAANIADKVGHGTMLSGHRCGQSILTAEQVREIRAARLRGERLTAIGARFGTHMSNVSQICRGQSWKGAEYFPEEVRTATGEMLWRRA